MAELKSEDILTCLCLIVVGYFIAKMFSRRCNGFSVGGQPETTEFKLCQLNGAQKCSPTCTNQYFRKFNLDGNKITPTCSDVTVDKYPSCGGSMACDELIEACTGGFSEYTII